MAWYIHHQIIVFGRHGAQGRLGDTWLYDMSEDLWVELSPAHSPPPRSDAGMRSKNKSGRDIVRRLLPGGYPAFFCDDTWDFDPETEFWTDTGPEFSPPPPTTYGHMMVYDNINRQSILWSGHISALRDGAFSSTGYGNTIWHYVYPLNIWRETEIVDTDNPTARYWHQSTIDPEAGRMILFWGDGGHDYLADTWLYDVLVNNWERVKSETSPSPRTNAAITYDPIKEVVILF